MIGRCGPYGRLVADTSLAFQARTRRVGIDVHEMHVMVYVPPFCLSTFAESLIMHLQLLLSPP